MYTITKNEQYNSIEVSFDGKPSAEIREALKAMRFRWHGVKKVWYGRATIEDVMKAIGEPAQSEPEAASKAEPKATTGTPQDHVRIYFNGIKIDGEKIVRCHYSIGSIEDGLTIYACDYADLPRDLLPVENDSDSYTDYFENDRAHIGPEHPLYKYFAYAALKARARDAKRFLPRHEQKLAERNAVGASDAYYVAQIAACKKDIAAFEAAADPGQPTAEDLVKINLQRQEAENAARESERQEELRRRENLLSMRVNGLRLIRETMQAYPANVHEPRVLINWSEHPALGDFQEDSLYLSVAAAEIIMRTLDDEQRRTRDTAQGVGWYWKTKFHIIGKYDGEELNYEGRYDLGDGDGGLISHIRAFGEWRRAHNANDSEKQDTEQTNDVLQFAEWLEQFTAKEA